MVFENNVGSISPSNFSSDILNVWPFYEYYHFVPS